MINPKWSEWRNVNYVFLKKALSKFTEKERVLDLGCGPSQFYPILKKHRLTSCDIEPYPKADFVCDLTKEMIFKKGEFDIVVMSNSLEHMGSPEKIIKAVNFMLKPGGSLIVLIPFLMGEHQIPVDYQRYTRYGLSLLMETNGFKMADFETVGDPFTLCVESAWAAHKELKRKGYFLLKWITFVHAVLASKLRAYVHKKVGINLINSPFAETMAFGFMFVATKEK